MLKGGWWWKSCGRGLNGLYLNDPQDLTARQGDIYICIYIYLYLHICSQFNLFDKKFSFQRYCMVPLERLGLYFETCYDDD